MNRFRSAPPASFARLSGASRFSRHSCLSHLCRCSLLLALALSACKPSPVLVAERSAPIGQEFIRLYPDGKAEYGFAVVKENFKARGGYRYARDTVFFLDESFKPHFPAGYLPIKQDVLYMDNGLHFSIKVDKLDRSAAK